MYRVWFSDLDKAIKALLHAVPNLTMFTNIRGNAHGDFIFSIDEGIAYCVRHDDFSVWKMPKDWRKPWLMIFGPYDEDEIAEENAARESLGENWY